MSGLHHVGVRPRSLRYYTTERHSVMPARFRFTPKSGHVRCNEGCPLWANSGLMQCNRDVRFTPKADIRQCKTNVRFLGQKRHERHVLPRGIPSFCRCTAQITIEPIVR